MEYLSRANRRALKGAALLRLDFNTEDEWRMKAVLPTVKFLLRSADKIVIVSHRGRPSPVKISKGKPLGFERKLSLRRDAAKLRKFLKRKIRFVPHFRFSEIKQAVGLAPRGSIFLLENLRFFPGEESNDRRLARQLASLGDYYVNEAFAVSHRKNASICAITRFLPSYVGLEMEQELRALSRVLRNPKKPLVIVLGGAKGKDKLGILTQFKKKTDWFLIGGAVANTLLFLRGVDVKKSKRGRKPKDLKKTRGIAKWKKVILPMDYRWRNEMILDIGPRTAALFKKKIRSAKTIIWNGPMGLFEEKPFGNGTLTVARAIAGNRRAFTLAGGGETVEFLRKNRLGKKFNLISTGGGAMLEFLSGRKLPGIEALK